MSLNQITEKIIGAAIQVHRKLGPGLLESAYKECLAYELGQLGLWVEREKPVPLVYGPVKLECGFRADLLVEGCIVVELKGKKNSTRLTQHKCSPTCVFSGCRSAY